MILEGFTKERILPDINLVKRDYSNFHAEEFEETVIEGVDWNEICMLRLKNPDVSLKDFHDTIQFHLDEMAPLKKVKLKQYRLMLKPWLNSDIIKKCEEKNKLLKKIKEETNPATIMALRKQYKDIRNDITRDKRSSKKSYFAQKFSENRDNSSKIWKEIRSLVNIKSSKSSSIKILDDNQNLISDSHEISNIFNNHYATLGAKVQQKIPTQEGDYNFYLDKHDTHGRRYINPHGYTFYLSPSGPIEVDQLIDDLNIKKSTGPFGVPIFLLKKFKNFFSFWLSELANLSFESGTFPDILKVAKVNPLHKKDSKSIIAITDYFIAITFCH